MRVIYATKWNLKNPTTTKQSWEWYCLFTLVSLMPDTDQWLEEEAAPEQTGQYCYSYKWAGKVFLSLGLSNAFPISYSGFFCFFFWCTHLYWRGYSRWKEALHFHTQMYNQTSFLHSGVKGWSGKVKESNSFTPCSIFLPDAVRYLLT